MDRNLRKFVPNPVVIVGPGVSELLVTFQGGVTYLHCPNCGASVAAPTEGMRDMPILHEADCQWVDSIRARMQRKK
jgi:hypothetical protein